VIANRPQSRMISEEQRANFEKLKTDLKALRDSSNITPEQKEKLVTDLRTMFQGANPPSQESLKAFANALSQARSDGTLSSLEKMNLVACAKAVLDSSNIPLEEVEAVIADTKEIIAASGIEQADVEEIGNDLRAIKQEANPDSSPTQPQ